MVPRGWFQRQGAKEVRRGKSTKSLALGLVRLEMIASTGKAQADRTGHSRIFVGAVLGGGWCFKTTGALRGMPKQG